MGRHPPGPGWHAPAALGVDEAFSVDELDARLARLLKPAHGVVPVRRARRTRKPGGRLAAEGARATRKSARASPTAQRDLCGVLDEMRLFKDAHEIDR